MGTDYIKSAKASLLLYWDTPEKQIAGISSEQSLAEDDDTGRDPAADVLADLVERSGLPRKLAVLASIVDYVSHSSHVPMASEEEVDEAETEFVRAAQCVL